MDMDKKRNDPNRNKKPEGDKPKGQLWTALIITLALVLLFSWIYNTVRNSQYTQTTYTEFRSAMDQGRLSEVEIQADRIVYMTKEEAAKDPSLQRACYTGLPTGTNTMALLEELHAAGVQGDKLIVEDNSGLLMIGYYLIMGLMIFGVMNRVMGLLVR